MQTQLQSAWNKVALLSILEGAHRANEQPADNFTIQKLTFVSQLEGRAQHLQSAFYKFFRFTYGPYSSALANDVRQLESLGLIDPESREVTDRGRFLLGYVRPEIDASDTAQEALGVIDNSIEGWGSLRGWQIVNKVYELSVPVDGKGGEKMLVRDIPMHTDILVPSLFSGRNPILFSDDMLSDFESELSIPAHYLDPESPELLSGVAAGLAAALTF